MPTKKISGFSSLLNFFIAFFSVLDILSGKPKHFCYFSLSFACSAKIRTADYSDFYLTILVIILASINLYQSQQANNTCYNKTYNDTGCCWYSKRCKCPFKALSFFFNSPQCCTTRKMHKRKQHYADTCKPSPAMLNKKLF